MKEPKRQYTKAEKASWFNGIRYGLNKPRASGLYLQQHSDGRHEVPVQRSSFDADEFFKVALDRTYRKSKPRYVRKRVRLATPKRKK